MIHCGSRESVSDAESRSNRARRCRSGECCTFDFGTAERVTSTDERWQSNELKKPLRMFN
jgi:hypothetical protein